MTTPVRIAIIGSGPSGLSCAAHAASRKISHVLLEAESHASHTIYRYQKGKHVMAEPAILPLRSDLSFAAGRRETRTCKNGSAGSHRRSSQPDRGHPRAECGGCLARRAGTFCSEWRCRARCRGRAPAPCRSAAAAH